MNKETFLMDKDVRAFIAWLIQKLDGSFEYSYVNCRDGKEWKCNSIYNAYEKYSWRFSVKDQMCGTKFQESAKFLENLSRQLKESIDQQNNDLCIRICLSILEWGRVLYGNKEKIENMKDSLVDYLKEAKDKLTTDTIENSDFYKTKTGRSLYMNSGFTKIYSLYIDDFIIYDSRVGAALGLLVRCFYIKNNLKIVPKILAFAYGNSKGGINRNPSFGDYKFSLLRSSDRYNNHIENSLKANWLLEDLLLHSDSNFNKVNISTPLRALEAALFMIGYCIKEPKEINI